MKTMIKSDPFSNLRTSHVFLELLTSPRNPKGIADALGIKPPPVIEHLRRLQRINIVELGEKEGKAQNYRIIWKFFIPMFIEKALKEKYTHPKKVHAGEITEIRKLCKNSYFRALLEKYLRNIADNVKGGTLQTTLNDASREFQEGLAHSNSFDRQKKFDNPEKQEFFVLMKIWKRRAEMILTATELSLQDAITKTLKE